LRATVEKKPVFFIRAAIQRVDERSSPSSKNA
jgi:hypothetical protein